LEVFRRFLSDVQLDEIVADQWEVTYVNQITRNGPQNSAQLFGILTVLTGAYSDEFLDAPEESRLSLSYIIPDGKGAPIARLRIICEPAFRQADSTPIVLLKLVARGKTEGSNEEEILKCFDIGHRWIVRAFASITTPEMHTLWRRSR
jgi:hypothetical protein